MSSRFRRLGIESLEGRSVLSTLVEADFNGDGYVDRAEITAPTAITVSLNDGSGNYNVSEILKAPKSQPMEHIYVWDIDNDGDLDIVAAGISKSAGWYEHYWLNDGDGDFGSRTTNKHLWEGWI